MWWVIRKAAMTAIIGLALTTVGSAAELNCLPWKSATQVIARNSLLSADAIYQLVQKRVSGQIIHASLCEDGGRLSYKLVVLGPKGDVSNVTIDALTGQP